MSWFRRFPFALVALASLAACAKDGPGVPPTTPTAAPLAAARHGVLLHMADSHAQLETHPELMPRETPEIQPMGGYARLKTAIDRERAAARGRAFAVDLPRTIFSQDAVITSDGKRTFE